jgi:hypothetical protein
METLFLLLIIMMGIICWLITLLLSHFGRAKHDIWWAILFGILGGMCVGVYAAGMPLGLLIGVAIGLVIDLIVIPIGLWTRYWQRRGLKIMDKYRHSGPNELMQRIADGGWNLGTKLFGGDTDDADTHK